MTRVEVTTQHKSFVFYEDTEQEARDYVDAMEKNGVVILSVGYFDRDSREQDIRDGVV